MRRPRARNIDAEITKKIVSVIDGWSGKLGWDLLTQEIMRRTGQNYSRQALSKNESIYFAFSNRKKEFSGAPDEEEAQVTPEEQVFVDKIARLTAEKTRLEAENNRFIETFRRLAYNAYLKGVSEDQLNVALPGVDREQSRPGPAVKRGKSNA